MRPEMLKASENGFQQIQKALQDIKDVEGWTEDDEQWIECAAKRHNSSWTEDDKIPSGFSMPTWKRFINGMKGKPVNINAKAFKAFCSVLELDWEDIIEKDETKQETYKINPSITQKKNVNSNDDKILNIEGKPSLNFPCHNLPNSSYIEFVGRHTQLTDLKEKLSLKSNTSQITITGIGGVGKTSLILEAANDCLLVSQEKSDQNYQYDAIIFSTFKQQEITHEEIIIPSYKRELSCKQILKDIATTFDKKELLSLDFNNRIETTIDLLRKHKTLLIVDNLETVEDVTDIIWFFKNLPKTVKVVITSRQKTDFGISIELYSLSLKSGIKLIKRIAELQNINLEEKQEKDIYIASSGIPLAIVLILGQIAYHHFPESVIERFRSVNNHIVDYCFESSIKPLKGKSSYKLLTALALLSKITSDQIITEVANITDKEGIEKGFTELRKLNLLHRRGNKYEILPIIRSYVLCELKKDTDWEEQLRNRWVNWYKEFVRQYGGQNEKEWNNYEQLEAEWENITDVITWCINHNRYDDVKCFWQGIKGYSHVRGYQSDRLIGWNSRLEWTDWLITNARDNKDYATAVEVMFDRAWTLTLIGKPETLEQATRLFAQTWSLRKHHHNQIFQIDLAIHIAYFRFFQQKIKQAKQWLDYAKKLLEQSQSNLDNSSTSYQYILWYYYQGRIEFDGGDYLSAQQSFSKVLELATSIPHQRGISLAQRWLGNVAIELHEFDDAQKIFTENLSLTKDNKDRVGEAFCQQSLAFLAKKIGNMTECKHWAEEAISTFQDLGMMQEVKTTQDRLNQLEP